MTKSRRNDKWANTPDDARNRPRVNLTLDPHTVEALGALARRWGVSRSRAVDRIVEDYTGKK